MARRETLNRPWRARVLVSKDRPVGLLARASTRASVSATGRCAPLGGFRNACGEQLRGPPPRPPSGGPSLFLLVPVSCLGDCGRVERPRRARSARPLTRPASRATPPGLRAVFRVFRFPLRGETPGGAPLHWHRGQAGLARSAAPDTAQASSERWRPSSARSRKTGLPSTSESRSCTTRTSSTSFRQRGAVFVAGVEDVPEGGLVVFSAHGIAPVVRAGAAARSLRTIDATCPLVTKVHAEAKRYAAEGYTVVLIGHAGHEEVEGTMGEAPDSIVPRRIRRRRGTTRNRESAAGRLRHPDDAVRRRDARDHRRPPPPLPEPARTGEGRHLLRDHQPAAGGQGALSHVQLLLVLRLGEQLRTPSASSRSQGRPACPPT